MSETEILPIIYSSIGTSVNGRMLVSSCCWYGRRMTWLLLLLQVCFHNSYDTKSGTDSGVGAWYQLRNEDFISVSLGIWTAVYNNQFCPCINRYACTHHYTRSTPFVLLYTCSITVPLLALSIYMYSARRTGQSKTGFICEDNQHYG